MRKVGPAKLYTLSARLPSEQIMSQSSDLILILDEFYIIRDVNDSLLLAFGCSKDELNNLDINTTSMGPGLIDRIRDSVKQGMAGKESAVNAWIPVQKEWKAFRIRIIPLVFGWGDKGIVVMLEDRTEEILGEEENTLLADLLNASPAAITVHDFEGNFLYSNKKNLDLHGYSQSEFRNLNLSNLDIPESAKCIADRVNEIRKNGEASFEVVHVRKDGQHIPLEVHAKTARWGDRDVIISIATDISERKRAEHALRESEHRFADIIDFLPDATYVVNSEGIVIAWNRAIEEMTGVPATDMIGKGNYEYALPFYGERRPILLDLIFNDDPDVRKHYRYLQKEGSTFTAETVLTLPGAGEQVLWLKASPLYDKDGRITGAIESIRDITERKKSEEALLKSKERFNQVAENTGEWIWEVDAEGIYTYCSSAVEKILGYSADELVGRKHYYDLFAPDVRETLTELTLAAFQRKDAFRKFVNPNIHKNGSIVILETSGSPVLDDQGTLLGYRGADLDITEQRRAEEALRESEEKFRAIVETSPDLIWEIDLLGRLRYVSPMIGRLMGYSSDEVVGKPIAEMITEQARPRFMQEMARTMSSKGVIPPMQFPAYHHDGHEMIIEIRVARLTAPNGTLIGFRGIAVDITERTKAEEALRESEEKFRALVENSLDGILITDLTGTLLFANRAAGRIVDAADYQSLIGIKNMMEFVAPESRADVLCDFRQVMQGIDAYLAHYKIITEMKREIWVECIGKKILFGGSTAILVSVRDVTERMRTDMELRESENKFATVFQSSPVALTLVSATDGTFVDVNDTFLKNTGFRSEDVIGKTSNQLGIFVDNNEYAQMVSLIQDRRHVQGMELRCRIKTGEIRICRFSSGIIMMGDKPHVLSSVEDITGRKQAESAFQAMVTGMVGTTGIDSLDRIAESISRWLGADCIMIGEITPDGERVQVLSMLLDGKKITNYSYILKGTPCENTAEKGFCIFPDEVLKLFPKSRDLQEFNIRGYAGTPLRNFEGQVVGILCILSRKPLNLPPSAREILDIITIKAAAEIGRRNALEALHESERKFRTIFENSPYPMAINSYPDHKFLEVNAEFLHASGYTEREILGKNPVELGLLSLMDSAILAARMLSAGKLENVPLALTGKGGRRIHVLFSTIPVTINDRPAIVTVTAEVTKLKRVEKELLEKNEALKASEERMALVMNGVPTFISYMDPEMRFVYINKPYAEWYGCTEEELIGKCLTDLLPEDVFLRAMPYYQKALSGQEVVFENPTRDREGRERVLSVHLVPHIRNGHVVGIFAALDDVTGRR